MRKFLLRALTFILVATLFSAPLAFASTPMQPSVDIQLNGKLMDFPNGVLPVFDGNAGKVYVPFRDLFEAFGAEVSYDDATRTVSAVLDDTIIDFNQDEGDIINVTRDGVVETLTMDVPAITVNGRVLVPVRFISETIGVNVGWDQREQTVVIIDADTILAANTAEYTVIDKLLKMQTTTGKSEGKAVLDFDMEISDPEYGSVSLPVDMTMDFVTSEAAFDGNFHIKTDLTGIFSSAVPGLTAKYEIDGEIILNLQKGLFAIQCDTLTAAIDPSLAQGTWLTMDFFEALGELSFDTEALEYDSAGELVNEALRAKIEGDYITSIYDYEAFEYYISLINSIISDDAFVKKGNDYVSIIDRSEDGDTDVMVITLKTNDAGEATSFSLGYSMDLYGTVMKMTCETDGKDMSLDITASDESTGLSLNVSFDVKTQSTTKSPRTKVPAGAVTLDVYEYFG